jgi:nucleoid-associated protein YgaU
VIPRSISPYERFGRYVPVEDAALTEVLFTEADTLSGLAHQYYGDWRKWRVIADRNKVRDPRAIAPGTMLVIPQQPLERGALESF